MDLSKGAHMHEVVGGHGHGEKQTDFVCEHHKAIAFLHQRVAHEAQLAVRFPLRYILGWCCVRFFAAWLASKVTPIGVLTILGHEDLVSLSALDETPRKLPVQSKSSIQSLV